MYKIIRIGKGAYQLEVVNYTANIIDKSYIPDIPVSFKKIIKLKKERECFNNDYKAFNKKYTCSL